MTALKEKTAVLYRRYENAKVHWPEFLILCAYVFLLSVFMYFHEPWYDEAQAWLIARDASWKDIFFLIPHYEGHPPLWYLILAVFAKAGANFDLTIKILTLVINAFAMAFLLFRAPFPRFVRHLLPFTYFLFYQHGVICRPYSLLLLGFLLAADFWHTKDEKPFRFTASLMLMCASSAYGIIFAGGITIVWLLELYKKQPLANYFCSLLKGKRFFALLTLLLFALLNIASIMPRSDTFAASYGVGGDNPVWMRLLYMFFGSISDATCFSAYEDYDELRYVVFSYPKLAVGCLIGIFLLLVIYGFGKRSKNRLLFFVPFTLFALFSGIVYFYLQHIDVLLQFLIFWCWVCRKSIAELPKEECAAGSKFSRCAPSVLFAGTCICLVISVSWTVAACYHEVRFQYGFSKQLATYLDNHGLTDYGIMVRWMQLTDDYGMPTYNNTNQTVNGVALNAYYDKNIVINMNNGDPDMTYVTHQIPTDEETQATLQSWRDAGFPEITLDRCQLKSLFPEYRDVYTEFYTEVLKLPEYHLWKGGYTYTEHTLYVRSDITRKHLLKTD